MDILNEFYKAVVSFIPSTVAIVILILVIWFVRLASGRRSTSLSRGGFQRQLLTLVLSFIGLLVVILLLPLSGPKIERLLSLVGILLTAAIALSSTTFLGNIMSGLMLRAIRNFRGGDFIKVGDNFGRVTERGLFHVEIQTENRDLITLPNLFLVTNPVEVVRPSGIVIAAELSLGYDISHELIEELLKEAALETKLTEPFVHLIDLGDFSIKYRVAGLLTDTRKLLSARSDLRRNVLKKLHDNEIEIVSPTFMNTRALLPDRKFVPSGSFYSREIEEPAVEPEKIVFDKADEAASIENLKSRHEKLTGQLEELKKNPIDSDDPDLKKRHQDRLDALVNRIEQIQDYIKLKEEKQKRESD
jgi:small-conductance mechanosensitive channel